MQWKVVSKSKETLAKISEFSNWEEMTVEEVRVQKKEIVGLWESLGVRDWSGKVSHLTMLDWTALWVPPE